MKGIVFCELINMVEECFSLETADQIIAASNLETGGAYTAVGTYDHREIVELVSHLSTITGTPAAHLLRNFGEYLFRRFSLLYPTYFATQNSTFDFLGILDNKIHVEVKKLYPDAELPVFHHEFPDRQRMVFVYMSSRPFGDLAEGLIRGCIDYFKEKIVLTREDLPAKEGTHVRFTLNR